MSRAEILRNVPLRALLVAEIVSTTGSQMTWLALPWFVLTTTGSPARMTFVMIAELVGATAAGLPAGVLLQRLGALFVPQRAPLHSEEGERGLLTGLRFLVREPLLRVWIPLFVAGDAAWQTFFAAVPVLVVERFNADPKIAGILFAGFGAGALVGNFASFRFLTQRFDGLRLIALSVPFQALP